MCNITVTCSHVTTGQIHCKTELVTYNCKNYMVDRTVFVATHFMYVSYLLPRLKQYREFCGRGKEVKFICVS